MSIHYENKLFLKNVANMVNKIIKFKLKFMKKFKSERFPKQMYTNTNSNKTNLFIPNNLSVIIKNYEHNSEEKLCIPCVPDIVDKKINRNTIFIT